MIHADDAVSQDYTPTTLAMAVLMRPEWTVSVSTRAALSAACGNDSGTADHSRREEERRRGGSFSDIEAACIALQVGLQSNASGGQSERGAHSSSCKSALRRDNNVGVYGSVY
jgi:hypothetical protein